jgi:hypothetical protein
MCGIFGNVIVLSSASIERYLNFIANHAFKMRKK